ncbi:MAG: sterol desaturase family protein [Taibaiella sp.]|nr:sterol desaturase family protein [Taibaiella sp.]
MEEFYRNILLLFNIPIYAIFIPLEILLSNARALHFYSVKETIVNIYLNLLNAGIDMLLRIAVSLTVLSFFYRHHAAISWHPVAYWVTLILLEDFLFWLEHYVDHKCRLFWAVHVTHHSSPEYNLTTGFRSSVFMPMYRFLYFIPLALLNFRPADIFFTYAITQSYGILVHTRAINKLPRWVEYIFVTPSHHRVHHASNTPYLDKNMGMLLIVWDRIFGTFTAEQPGEKPVYGLTKPLEKPFHPIGIVFHEWKAIAADFRKKVPFTTKLKYLLKPPGWSHDGSTQTAKQMQEGSIKSAVKQKTEPRN